MSSELMNWNRKLEIPSLSDQECDSIVIKLTVVHKDREGRAPVEIGPVPVVNIRSVEAISDEYEQDGSKCCSSCFSSQCYVGYVFELFCSLASLES